MRRPIAGFSRLVRRLFAGAPWWLRLAEFGLLIAALVASRDLTVFLWQMPSGDVVEYQQYALAFWTTNPLFHALPVEYPPLAIVPFSLTQLPPISDYPTVYAIWMGVLFLVGYVGFLRFSTNRRALVYAMYLLIGATATLLARFDLLPALATLAALWAAQRRRFGYAYLLLAIGVLLKLYPIFLLPVLMIEHWRVASASARLRGYISGLRRAECLVVHGRLRTAFGWLRADPVLRRVAQGAVLCLGVVVMGFLMPMALNPTGTLSGFGYAAARPIQIESTPASLLWLGTLVGIPAHPIYSFVSLNYTGKLAGVLKPLSSLALAGGCLLVYYRQLRGKLTFGQAIVACLCAVIVTNKIFSPQYLIWIVPIVAAVDGLDPLWVVICVLTTIDFPILYQAQHPIINVPYSAAFMPVLAARNGLLAYVTARAIFRARVARGAAAAPAPRPAEVPATDATREDAPAALIGQAG